MALTYRLIAHHDPRDTRNYSPPVGIMFSTLHGAHTYALHLQSVYPNRYEHSNLMALIYQTQRRDIRANGKPLPAKILADQCENEESQSGDKTLIKGS